MIPKRSERVAEEIHKEISSILRRSVKDPRLHRVTITHIKVSPDLKHAGVYFSILGDVTAREDALNGFKRAGPFIRKELGHHLRLRRTPDLRFYYDDSIEHAVEMSRTLNQLKEERERTPETNREHDPE
jgi:ribosome-binding factor A